MPMTDVYAVAGTFPEPHRLAADLASSVQAARDRIAELKSGS